MITYCEKTKKRLRNFVPVTSSAFYVSEMAMRSILLELSATPKPGLVDRSNNGSHSDMSYETFILSTSAVIPYFSYMAQAGIECGISSGHLCNLLPVIRTIGLAAEQHMFSVTGGVNTQKGIIFLVGLTCGACGYLLSLKEHVTPATLSAVIREISGDIVKNELSDLESKRKLTSGEKIFLQYKMPGVRGEAQEGFPSVINYGLPALKSALNSGLDLNYASLHALCNIMAHLDDTALLHRHNLATLRTVQGDMDELYQQGGLLTDEGREKWE
ncbi:MAG: triphosphoribosyl-dephospho-CoA synthase, partial [Candidatus Eremiobacterota bacterium]